MKLCKLWRFQFSRRRFAVVIQAPLSSSEAAPVREFYSSFSYDDELQTMEVPDMSTQLLPFQKEGVGWMAQREMNHVGGIMADHLGMGKTVQMIGLCLVSDKVNKSFHSKHLKQSNMLAEGSRLITVLRQMQRISVVANCSRINRPGDDLNSLISSTNERVRSRKGNFKAIRSEIDKWLHFAGKFHPSYADRAKSFLDDAEKKDYQLIVSKELRTLVVVPASLMLQWKSEIESKVKASKKITIYLYHGDNKWVSSTELETYDFVITTYETLTNSSLPAFIPGDKPRTFAFSRKEAGPLFQIHWKRIILDEAHMIRHTRTQRWRAVQELQGLHRWAVTATPLHNSIDDLQNLLHFIGLPRLPILPGTNSEELLNDPILQRSIARSLQPAFLRRGPVMIRNGVKEVLVQLPPKTEVVMRQSFTVKESHMYNSVLARSKSALASSEDKDGGVFHIFAMMTRLRQACCHPWISRGRAVQVSVCGICKNEASSAVVTKCGHVFCHECLLLQFRDAVDGDEVATRTQCPNCSQTITYASVFKQQTLSSHDRIAQYRRNEFELSTKLRMVLRAIHEMQQKHPDDKMIIFSQFTSFMDVVTVALERYKIASLRIDGTMTLSARNAVIRQLQNDKSVKIVLASKTSTGVGLNLTAANHVVVVDPWWNPAIEEQAVHRCYRIGQKKPVYVTRFIISDTIEQYCYEICQRKKEFGDAVLRAATAGDSGAKMAASRLHELMSRLKYVGDGEQDAASAKSVDDADAASNEREKETNGQHEKDVSADKENAASSKGSTKLHSEIATKVV
ncbi:dNA repair protein-like protein [Leptomonas pyrrhocoris]|uniref:DNA repair protein-like protein n=1 Tax=Leptomonas pyrrhocoris TaxID=157538 RepID=A0A0N0DZM4_LEPPY|nr:dNA repair protein-like protein [Leptomonas pyrrhocoris]XP_015663908.1 dNA repair protein-like protein [Leptomonas pyrrhocoris]KPA85468.1 dNA repair protein-like protein [Leptomonas pyrrhocoris]KPA85469.1 dNA repair protein-like protein [Leptomonas pyrrhocoris]|eukprot:XP_015663907.1 dNA repair protein-like protein [Leptomonas pyrrhocoris]